MPRWLCAKTEAVKKMTEREGETDTQHSNSFIRRDSSCILYTQRQKDFQDTRTSCARSTRISFPNGGLINVEHAFIPAK